MGDADPNDFDSTTSTIVILGQPGVGVPEHKGSAMPALASYTGLMSRKYN